MIGNAPVLSTHPLEALLQLDKAAREGRPIVVMPADPRLDPNLKDEDGEHLDPRDHEGIDLAARRLVDERRKEVRVIGPAGGLARGAGEVALVSALGPGLFERLVKDLGPSLRIGVDLGLGWDVTAGEVLLALADESPRRVLLALPPPGPPRAPEADPPPPWLGLADGLAAFANRGIPVHAVAVASEVAALTAHGVSVVPDLGSLVEAGRRSSGDLVVVSSLGGGASIGALIDAFELPLAELSEMTLLALERELPRQTRLGPHLQVTSPTPRHLEVIRGSLAADPAVGEVWWAIEDPDPWSTARALAGRAKTHTPEPTLAAREPRERLQAELMGLRLMKRLALERDPLASLLRLETAPAFAVTSLAAALNAAERIGYPVRLTPSPTPLADREALTQAWERLVAELSAPTPLGARGPMSEDAWHARKVLPALETVRLVFTAHPLPVATLGPTAGRPDAVTLPLPVRVADLERFPSFAGVLEALTEVAAHHPELASLELELDLSGRLVDGAGALLQLPG